MHHRIHLAMALFVGACAGSSTTLVAEPAPPDDAPPAEPEPGAKPRQGTHVKVEEAELRIAPNDKGSVRLLARGDEAFLGQLELEPLAEIPPHRDPTEEYIVVLEGGGTLLMDGRGYQLTKGSVVFMPANAEVSYANGPDTLVALQVFAGPSSADKYDKWKPEGSAPVADAPPRD